MGVPRSFIFTRGPIHCWHGERDVLVSNENTKRLLAFSDWNSAVNHLFVVGFKETARALNAALNAANEPKEGGRA